MFLSDLYAKKVFKNNPEFRPWLPVEVLAEDDTEVSTKNPDLNNSILSGCPINTEASTGINFSKMNLHGYEMHLKCIKEISEKYFFPDASNLLGKPKQTHSRHSMSTSARKLTNTQKILASDEYSPSNSAKDTASKSHCSSSRTFQRIRTNHKTTESSKIFNTGRASSNTAGGSNVPKISGNPEAQFPIFCRFCYDRGDRRSFYTNHQLKDKLGNIKCPMLRSLGCQICGAKKDLAHTYNSCPRLIEINVPMIKPQNLMTPNITGPPLFQQNIRFSDPQSTEQRYPSFVPISFRHP